MVVRSYMFMGDLYVFDLDEAATTAAAFECKTFLWCMAEFIVLIIQTPGSIHVPQGTILSAASEKVKSRLYL